MNLWTVVWTEAQRSSIITTELFLLLVMRSTTRGFQAHVVMKSEPVTCTHTHVNTAIKRRDTDLKSYGSPQTSSTPTHYMCFVCSLLSTGSLLKQPISRQTEHRLKNNTQISHQYRRLCPILCRSGLRNWCESSYEQTPWIVISVQVKLSRFLCISSFNFTASYQQPPQQPNCIQMDLWRRLRQRRGGRSPIPATPAAWSRSNAKAPPARDSANHGGVRLESKNQEWSKEERHRWICSLNLERQLFNTVTSLQYSLLKHTKLQS